MEIYYKYYIFSTYHLIFGRLNSLHFNFFVIFGHFRSLLVIFDHVIPSRFQSLPVILLTRRKIIWLVEHPLIGLVAKETKPNEEKTVGDHIEIDRRCGATISQNTKADCVIPFVFITNGTCI